MEENLVKHIYAKTHCLLILRGVNYKCAVPSSIQNMLRNAKRKCGSKYNIFRANIAKRNNHRFMVVYGLIRKE